MADPVDYKKWLESSERPKPRFIMGTDDGAYDLTNGPSLAKVQTGQKKEVEKPSLAKAILNVLNTKEEDSIERLAFETDPDHNTQFGGLFVAKTMLIPDDILKRIMIQDDLVASIVNARSNHLASFGIPRPDRFSKGFSIEFDSAVLEQYSEEDVEKWNDRKDRATKIFANCGSRKGWSDDDQMTLSQFLWMSTRNAVGVGRIATEILFIDDPKNPGAKLFHSFRPIDAGTIYKAKDTNALNSIRAQAYHVLKNIQNPNLNADKYFNGEYAWVQVIKGQPRQAFTDRECIVHNFYPVPDVELDGYPVTPLDTVISAVTTHINITTHNKLYFQNGRAARGMLVVKSNTVNPKQIQAVRHQFNAAINSSANAHRMPVFGVNAEDDITWQPLDSGSRDMEFQYLSDMNARVILSAFGMSPEELPGWSYLSRGTSSQALSESNNFYQLTAHRDVGLRPLMSHFEDFFNARIFPLIDADLAKIARFKLVGLDADTAEKETIRIQQDMGVHMTMDEVLEKVEKEAIGKEFGGEFPLNQMWAAVADKYIMVGSILERFFGVPKASQDPRFQYIRDPFFFQWQQLMMQQQQMAMQQQQQQAQAAQAAQSGGAPQGDGSAPAQDSSGGGQDQAQGQDASAQPTQATPTENQQNAAAESSSASPASSDSAPLARSVDQALLLLSKSEKQLSQKQREMLARQKAVVDYFKEGWEKDSSDLIANITNIALKPKK